MTVKTKICGITTLEQALKIAELNIAAIGFILYPRSPRFVPPQKVKEIIFALPPFLKTVGVFVDEPVDHVVKTVQETGLDAAQLSGNELPEYCESLGKSGIIWLKAFRIKDSKSILHVKKYNCSTVLLDAWDEKDFGGTGKTFDWSLIEDISQSKKIILAGGLKPENVEEAIKTVKPYAVDVSSGVETSPGVKSLKKINELLKRIEAAEID